MYDLGVEEQTELVFREQADGRKVARLPSGKVALVHYDRLEDVHSGETWLVRLSHRDTYAVAYPLEKVKDATHPGSATLPESSSSRPLEQAKESLPFQVVPRIDEPELEEPLEPAEEAETAPATKIHEESVGNRRLSTEPSALHAPTHAISRTDRVAFFVDAANMDSACRDAGYFVDFGKVVRHFLGQGAFYAAYYYVADFTVDRDSRQVTFLDYLNHAGYVVRLKKVKRIIDRDTQQEIFKANVDTEIVVDMLDTADNYDVAYLFSGDSDFERLVDILRSRGKRVYVVSSRNTISRELAYVADKPIVFLEDQREALLRER